MSNNAYIRLDGGGIGWAQVLRAWACGLAQGVDMKPPLLKLTTEQSSQLMVRGHVAGINSARYTEQDYLRAHVRQFSAVASGYELIVLEGTGGAAEISLRDRDGVGPSKKEPYVILEQYNTAGRHKRKTRLWCR